MSLSFVNHALLAKFSLPISQDPKNTTRDFPGIEQGEKVLIFPTTEDAIRDFAVRPYLQCNLSMISV